MGLLVLLPPSEGKSEVALGKRTFSGACPEYAVAVAPVIKHLRALPKAERGKFYGVSTADKAAAAHVLNLSVLQAPAIPAIERYTGVVYEYLGYNTLQHPAYARKHLLIVSGMFGLIPAGTPIPNYKLPINAWLTRYWHSINAQRLSALSKGHLVVSLLPGAHAKALGVVPDLTIDFRLAGGKKSAGHFGKAIKGKFVRFLMEEQVKNLKGVASFREDGYVFDGQNFVQP